MRTTLNPTRESPYGDMVGYLQLEPRAAQKLQLRFSAYERDN
jgi:hypothetical protein